MDECLPVEFRRHLMGHDAHTVQWAGLKGKKNGELLDAAEAAGYEVLLTVDHGLPRQRHSSGGKLSIIVIRPRTNQMEDLLPIASAILEVLQSIQSGEIVVVPLAG